MADVACATKKRFQVELEYGTYDCVFRIDEYVEGGIYLGLLFEDEELGGELSPLCDVTMWVAPLEPGFACIKDYGENAGLLKSLIAGGFVEKTGRYIRSGFVDMPVCKLNMDKIREHAVEQET